MRVRAITCAFRMVFIRSAARSIRFTMWLVLAEFPGGSTHRRRARCALRDAARFAARMISAGRRLCGPVRPPVLACRQVANLLEDAGRPTGALVARSLPLLLLAPVRQPSGRAT